MNPLARAWAAASRPEAFFETLPDRPEIGRAAAVAAASGLVGALTVAILLIRATDSTGRLPLVLGIPALVLPYLALVSLLGGLVLMRPAALDVRAWEIVGWSWLPAGFLGLSLLPVGLVAPVPTLIGGMLMLAPWHLWMVWNGTVAHAQANARAAVVLYAVTVFGLPLVLIGFTLAVLSNVA